MAKNITLTQLFLGLVWLAATMYAAHVTITGAGWAIPALGAAVAALPGVVAATLVTGASFAAAAGRRLRGPGGRLPAGLALGTLFGLAAVAAQPAQSRSVRREQSDAHAHIGH